MCCNALKYIDYELEPDEKEGPFNGPSFSSGSNYWAILTSGEP